MTKVNHEDTKTQSTFFIRVFVSLWSKVSCRIQALGESPMPLTLAPQEPFLVAEWRKPNGFSRVFSHNSGRLAPYRYQSQWHWARAHRFTLRKKIATCTIQISLELTEPEAGVLKVWY